MNHFKLGIIEIYPNSPRIIYLSLQINDRSILLVREITEVLVFGKQKQLFIDSTAQDYIVSTKVAYHGLVCGSLS